MNNENDWLSRRFRRNVVFEGMTALYEHRFRDWRDQYLERDEIYLPGKMKYVDSFSNYIDSNCGVKFLTFNPR
jgi:hypothetical protein